MSSEIRVPPADLGDQRFAREQWNAALADLLAGLRRWPLWVTLAYLEIRRRYRRSLIGPFWITLSVSIFVFGIGVVYSSLFHIRIAEYLPYAGLGIILWTLISTLMVEGCTVFIASEAAIKQNPVPISVHVYRVIWRNLIIFAHNILIYVFLVLLFPIKINAALLLVPVGMALTILAAVGFILVLGILSVRFRDVPEVINNLISLAFFVTPIFWNANSLQPQQAWVAEANPLYHLLNILRAPLLGEVPNLFSYLVVVVFIALTLTCGILLYARFCRRIAYWL